MRGRVDELMQRLMQAQASGANPMVLNDLQMQIQQAQRGMQDWQQQQYAQQMSQMARPSGAGSVGGLGRGGRPGQTQAQQDPYLQMMLMNQLGMGGGMGPLGQ
jgi:hypothetical protein